MAAHGATAQRQARTGARRGQAAQAPGRAGTRPLEVAAAGDRLEGRGRGLARAPRGSRADRRRAGASTRRATTRARLLLLGVCADDVASWLHAEREHGLYLGAAGAVEARAERRESADERQLGVALDVVVGVHVDVGERPAPRHAQKRSTTLARSRTWKALRGAGRGDDGVDEVRDCTASSSLHGPRLNERTFLSLTPGPTARLHGAASVHVHDGY